MTYQNTFQRVNCSDNAVNTLAEQLKNKVFISFLKLMSYVGQSPAVHYSRSADGLNRYFREFQQKMKSFMGTLLTSCIAFLSLFLCTLKQKNNHSCFLNQSCYLVYKYPVLSQDLSVYSALSYPCHLFWQEKPELCNPDAKFFL